MWVSEQLKQLAELYNVILGSENTYTNLAKQYSISTTHIESFHLDTKLNDCAGKEGDECSLSMVLRSGKAYCSDFDMKSGIMGGFSRSTADVVMDAGVEVPSQKSSCSRCFYSRMVYELTSRMKHATLSAKMKIGGRDRNVSLLGIGYADSKDAGRRRGCLSLRCTVGGRSRVFLVACMDGNAPCLLEIVPIQEIIDSGYSRYLIDSEAKCSVLKDKAQVDLQPIEVLGFRTPGDAVENLYSAYRQQFDMAFRLYFGQLTSGAIHREKILKSAQPRTAVRTSISESQSTLLGTPALKVIVGVSLVWIVVILVRESQARPKEKASIL